MRRKKGQRAPSNNTKPPRKATHCNKGKNKETMGVNNQTTNQLIRGAEDKKKLS